MGEFTEGSVESEQGPAARDIFGVFEELLALLVQDHALDGLELVCVQALPEVLQDLDLAGDVGGDKPEHRPHQSKKPEIASLSE